MTQPASLLRLLCLLVLGLAVSACGNDAHDAGEHADRAERAGQEDEHDHGAEGPHGGAMAVVGDHVAHLEAVHDEVTGQVTVYVTSEDYETLELDQPPTMNLLTAAGSVQVKATSIGSAWIFEHEALRKEPEKARFRLVIDGRTYQPDMPCSHDHDAEHGEHEHEGEGEGTHDHGDEHGHEEADHADRDHGPHDGVMAPFGRGVGHLELKLHDDKGDLELWLYADEDGETPYDVHVGATIAVAFLDHGGKQVSLAVRDRDRNEDEDGNPNLRDGKTNYFIFPGDTGIDATWLTGADFVSKVTVAITAAGQALTTEPFELRPHAHDGHDH